jgi:hypothetical protein
MNVSIRSAILLVVILVGGCSDLRRNAEKIEASLLLLTPLGSSPEAVLEVVKAKRWKTAGYRLNGFYRQRPKAEVVGVSSIEASLGDYWFFPIGTTNATAFWGFDENGRLIQIWVWKTTDTL